jgi:hypothetical protein
MSESCNWPSEKSHWLLIHTPEPRTDTTGRLLFWKLLEDRRGRGIQTDASSFFRQNQEQDDGYNWASYAAMNNSINAWRGQL